MLRSNWLDPAWEAEAGRWVLERLASLGQPVAGPVERVRTRPWSVQLRAPTRTGTVWFKANIPGAAYEAALVSALAGWAPEAVLAPLAVDPDRGWMLSPDGGATLREAQAGAPDPGAWEEMLVSYAELQRTVAANAADLAAVGVPDARPGDLPTRLTMLLDDPQVAADLGGERRRALYALVPAYADWCAELAADGIPATIQHDDLHDGNVFAQDGRYRFFDWADSSVAHPFGSLLVTMRVAGLLFKLDPGAPELARLRDAYLEPWTADRDRGGLLRSAFLATRVAIVGRALSWQRALAGAETPVDADDRTAVAEWLAELLELDGERS